MIVSLSVAGDQQLQSSGRSACLLPHFGIIHGENPVAEGQRLPSRGRSAYPLPHSGIIPGESPVAGGNSYRAVDGQSVSFHTLVLYLERVL